MQPSLEQDLNSGTAGLLGKQMEAGLHPREPNSPNGSVLLARRGGIAHGEQIPGHQWSNIWHTEIDHRIRRC